MQFFEKIWSGVLTAWSGLLQGLDTVHLFFAKGAAVLLALVVTAIPQLNSLEGYIKDQIPATIAYAPWFWLTSQLRPLNDDVESALEKVGGYIKGVAHAPAEQAVLDANVEWTRHGMSFPYNIDGSVSDSWKETKRWFAEYKALGIKVLAITPSPGYWVEAGVDPRLPENEERIREISAFIMTELKDLVDGIQTCNEIGIPMFTSPLTTKEACRLMALQLEGFSRVDRGNVIVGYTTAITQMDVQVQMRPYLQYVDWIGTDIHLGSHMAFGSNIELFDVIIDILWGFTGKPIILTEYGYLSAGKTKTEEEKNEILAGYGYKDEADARAHIDEFITKLPEKMQDKINRLGGDDKANYIFNSDCANHLWKEIPSGAMLPGYEHTLEGEAQFFADMIPKLAEKPYLIGQFPYEWQDGEECSWCGQADCPIEATNWGLINADGSAKPALEAVKNGFANIDR
ncbi:MAG: hypothetical protein LBB67_08125 [Oscillospiraceae bacterium]|jgi:hypothetical protein|nr:hypothetical protein [Oscillospiraceae bacterium]